MNMGIIVAVIILTFLILIAWACVVNNVCLGCNEPATRCKSCKHYGPPLVASNYEPKEDEMKEVDFLAKRINALDDNEFKNLCRLVKSRGYENGRD